MYNSLLQKYQKCRIHNCRNVLHTFALEWMWWLWNKIEEMDWLVRREMTDN